MVKSKKISSKLFVFLDQIQIQLFYRYFFKFMRGSPITNLRQRPDYTTSPYQSNPRPSSPRTGQNSPNRQSTYQPSNEGQYWRQKSHQLESQLMAVNEQLLFQIRKCQKIDDLEQKIELLLAQNTHFVDQNQNLIRLVQQKNGEIEVWKRKFNTEYSNSNLAEAEKRKVFDHLNIKDQEHQIQIEKLLAQITRLQDQAVETDSLKKLEIHRIKNQYESQSIAQIQNLRRSQNGNAEIQELNIKKLKDTIEEKQFQIQNLNRQIRLKNQELKAEASYSKNELKKLEEQKVHELDLVKTQFQNVKNNLVRAHKKNEDELKNLHETKVKRLAYEIQQKKHQIQQGNNRLKRTGKEGQSEIARLINQNGNLRNELKDNDNKNRQRIQELTTYYDAQFEKERETSQQREQNQKIFYENQITLLQDVIAAKEAEIQRILEINSSLKQAQDKRLQLIKENNFELKSKITQIVAHYERQIELTKIKVAELYDTDLQSLKSQLKNSYANHTLQIQNIRNQLSETRQKLSNQVQDRLDLRKEYELRLTEFNVAHNKNQRQLKNVVAQRQKQIEGHTSKASLTHIEHNQLLQTRNVNMKQIMAEKRNLQNQIQSKNKEIQVLNLKVQQMLGLHQRDIDKLEQDLQRVKDEHNKWLERQDQQNDESNLERQQLNKRIDQLNTQIADIKKKNSEKENSLNSRLDQRGIQISKLKGVVQELENKVKGLGSRNQVEQENVEKTVLQTRTLMNSEKEKLLETAAREKDLQNKQNSRIRNELQDQIDDLRKENDTLRDNYQKIKIREAQLVGDVRGLTESVNKRSKLQEDVINIGLSNNYFKNVAQIFKRQISI